jgi:hypothetical protein
MKAITGDAVAMSFSQEELKHKKISIKGRGFKL